MRKALLGKAALSPDAKASGLAPSPAVAALAAAARNSWRRLMLRVFLPLGMPGLAFGMAITFLKTMDDLATPLSLGVTNLLAPQAFFRVSAYGSQDPLSSLIATLLVLISALAWLASLGLVRQQVVLRSAGEASAPATPSRQQTIVGLGCLGTDLVGDGLGDLLRELAVLHGIQWLPLSGETAFWQPAPGHERH